MAAPQYIMYRDVEDTKVELKRAMKYKVEYVFHDGMYFAYFSTAKYRDQFIGSGVTKRDAILSLRSCYMKGFGASMKHPGMFVVPC